MTKIKEVIYKELEKALLEEGIKELEILRDLLKLISEEEKAPTIIYIDRYIPISTPCPSIQLQPYLPYYPTTIY